HTELFGELRAGQGWFGNLQQRMPHEFGVSTDLPVSLGSPGKRSRNFGTQSGNLWIDPSVSLPGARGEVVQYFGPFRSAPSADCDVKRAEIYADHERGLSECDLAKNTGIHVEAELGVDLEGLDDADGAPMGAVVEKLNTGVFHVPAADAPQLEVRLKLLKL